MNREEKIMKLQELITEKEEDLTYQLDKQVKVCDEVEKLKIIIESAKESMMRLESEREDDEE